MVTIFIVMKAGGTKKSEYKASATMHVIDNCRALPKELSEAFQIIQSFLSEIKR